MAVRGLMTRKMLENYRRIGGHPDGEEIILTLWQAMFVRQEHAEEEQYIGNKILRLFMRVW